MVEGQAKLRSRFTDRTVKSEELADIMVPLIHSARERRRSPIGLDEHCSQLTPSEGSIETLRISPRACELPGKGALGTSP